MLNFKRYFTLSVFTIVLGMGSQASHAVISGNNKFWPSNDPTQEVRWSCYAMEDYTGNPSWTKRSWCSIQAPVSPVYITAISISVKTTVTPCGGGAGGVATLQEVHTNPLWSSNLLISDIFHNTENYSHNIGELSGAAQVQWKFVSGNRGSNVIPFFIRATTNDVSAAANSAVPFINSSSCT